MGQSGVQGSSKAVGVQSCCFGDVWGVGFRVLGSSGSKVCKNVAFYKATSYGFGRGCSKRFMRSIKVCNTVRFQRTPDLGAWVGGRCSMQDA